MNAWYLVLGVILLIYGIWQTITTAKIYIKGEQDWLGADIKLLGGGIGALALGIIMIWQNI